MSLSMTASTTLLALTYLGVEPEEGQDPSEILDDTLGEYNLTKDQFLTEETCFAIGFHRGLAGRVFGDDEVPTNGEGPSEEISRAMEEAFAFGMEAREAKLTPPPSVVHKAWSAGEIEFGAFGEWAAGLDLSEQRRLSHAVTVGSGKSAVTVPAGTPVDVLDDSVEKDGVNHVIVLYDGLPLIVPNPEDDPRIVSGDTRIESKKSRKSSGKKAGKKGEPRQRGPALKDAIIHVLEGKDGGPGPLQTNGQFAGRVLKAASDMGIRDKAGAFVRKADRHVPYYCNCYKPAKEKGADGNETGNLIPGRTGVATPLVGTLARIAARKFYLKADGTYDERYASIPEEFRTAIEAAGEDERLTLKEPEPAPKKEKAPKAE